MGESSNKPMDKKKLWENRLIKISNNPILITSPDNPLGSDESIRNLIRRLASKKTRTVMIK